MRRLLRLSRGLFISVFIIIGVSLLSLKNMVVLDTFKPQLESAFASFLTRSLTIERFTLDYFPRPALVGYDVRLMDDDGELMAKSPELWIGIAPVSIIKRQLIFDKMVLVEPKAIVRRRLNGTFPLIEMIHDIQERLSRIREEKGLVPPRYVFKTLIVDSGTLEFKDETLTGKFSLPRFFVEAKGRVEGSVGERYFPFELQAFSREWEEKTDIRIAGQLGKGLRVLFSSPQISFTFFKPYDKRLKNWDGSFSIEGELYKDRNKLQWSASGETQKIIPKVADPKPNLKLTYSVSSNAPSIWKFRLLSEKTEADLFLRIPQTYDVTGHLNAHQVDIEELVGWFNSMDPLIDRMMEQEVKDPILSDAFFSAHIDLKAENAVYRDMKMQQMSGKLVWISTSGLVLDPLYAEALGGEMTGQAELLYTKSQKLNEADFKANWQIRNVKMDPILSSFTKKALLSGDGISEGYVSGSLKNLGWQNVDGRLTAEVNNGYVVGAPGFLKAFASLNLTSLLKKPAPNKEAFPFNHAKMDVVLNRGQVQFNGPAVIESDTLKIGILGDIDLVKNSVDGKLVFRFLSVLGEVVQVIPGVKTFIYQNEKALVPILVSVKGDLGNPNITVHPFQSLTKSIWNTVGGVLKLPFSAFNPDNEQ